MDASLEYTENRGNAMHFIALQDDDMRKHREAWKGVDQNMGSYDVPKAESDQFSFLQKAGDVGIIEKDHTLYFINPEDRNLIYSYDLYDEIMEPAYEFSAWNLAVFQDKLYFISRDDDRFVYWIDELEKKQPVLEEAVQFLFLEQDELHMIKEQGEEVILK